MGRARGKRLINYVAIRKLRRYSNSAILPLRWAKTTDEAISGGILYTVLAGIFDFISDWCRRFPDSPVILTEGDGTVFSGFLKNQYPELGERIQLDLDLVLVGMGICVSFQA